MTVALPLYKNRLHTIKKDLWSFQARPEQLPPQTNWKTWLILAGRGFGKTRAGAEAVRRFIQEKAAQRIALVGQSIQEARAVMVEGLSGLLSICSAAERPIFERTKNQLRFPNGAIATLYGADHYDKLRGPEFDFAWIDELAKFRHPDLLWEQLQLCLRSGTDPRCIVTTTPRPIPLITSLLKDQTTSFTRGSTFDNAANLPKSFIERIQQQFGQTRLGQQELYAELLTDTQGALWNRALIQYQTPPHKLWRRVVIAIDPATTHHENSDETGIVVVALDQENHVYVLDDLSGRLSPNEWGQQVLKAYTTYNADRIVAEVNKGGDLVERVIKSVGPHLSYRPVRATRGKYTRAEPIAALYEQKKVFHIRPFSQLEEQLCTYVPGQYAASPDRLDALVWGITDLMLESERRPDLKMWSA